LRISLILVALMIILTGCFNDDSETTQKKEDNVNENEKTASSTWRKPPNNLNVRSGQKSFSSVRDDHCWGTDEDGDPCTINPRDPDEVAGGSKMLRVSSGDKIILTLNNQMGSLPNPDKIEATEFPPGDSEGRSVELMDDDFYQGTFHAPDGNGRYYYTVYMKWDSEDLIGEVYYDFSIHVN